MNEENYDDLLKIKGTFIPLILEIKNKGNPFNREELKN